MRLAVPDLISPSYFPAIAAVQMGLLRDEGIDASLELRFPVTDAAAALRDGEIDLLAGAAHAPLYDARGWGDVALLAALSQRMYWFLVVAADSPVDAETWTSLRNVRIGAAPGPDDGLRRLFAASGVDIEDAGIEIAPVPGTDAASISFGVTAAEALRRGVIDAFWANGMGADVAVRDGVGRVIVDARRDTGTAAGAALATFPALMSSRALVETRPEIADAAVRALRRAQDALRRDPAVATDVAQDLFPAVETGLIAAQVARDAPYYHADVEPAALDGLHEFARWARLPGADTDPNPRS